MEIKMNIQTVIKAISAFFCAVITKFFGGFDAMLSVLICLVVIDYITGISAAGYMHKLSSKTGFMGIFKKICIMSAVALSHLLGVVMGIDYLRSLVIGFYVANEAISILENIALTGVPLPKKLIEVLEQLKNGEK